MGPRYVLLSALTTGVLVLGVAATGAGDDIIAAAPGVAEPSEDTTLPPSGDAGPRVVFLVDASGSMTDFMVSLKPRLTAAIRHLRTDAWFYIGLFSQGEPQALTGNPLIPATDANKEAACRLIESVKPKGQTVPERALRRAFALRPDALYLITDGEMDASPLRAISQLNGHRTTAVHLRVTALVSDPTFLIKAARETGGTYRWIDLDGPASHTDLLMPEHSDDGVGAFGVVDRAERVAFVCDVSTADSDIIAPVKCGLRQAIEGLSPRQRFYLAWSRVSGAHEIPAKGMTVADASAKGAAGEFLDGLIPLGQVSPVGALERAFQEKPDVLFLISSSDIDVAVPHQVARLNADHRVRVHTIGLRDPLGADRLREIASAHKGTYTAVSEEELLAQLRRRPRAATFFGLPVTGRRVVFAISRAGSMTDSMEDARTVLKQTIEQLAAEQQFHILFWTAGPTMEKPGGMVPATPENRKAAFEFVDSIIPLSQTDPDHALHTAFAAKPDEIFLLTSGGFGSRVSHLLETLNRDRAVAVHIVQLTWPHASLRDSDRERERITKTIAMENRGVYAGIGPRDLHRLAGGGEPQRTGAEVASPRQGEGSAAPLP
ncbi:MAG TPA: hypothetical protein PLP01_03745 [Phycisphaerae bacterium]|nr:hypothetical protein [Phycisphaerae bacterium]